jgi:hypothetical protein
MPLTAEQLDRGCHCPMGHPPCDFCTNMDEEEAEAFATGGIAAIRFLHQARKHTVFIDQAIAEGRRAADIWVDMAARNTPTKKTECTCSMQTLLGEGCRCGAIKRYSHKE